MCANRIQKSSRDFEIFVFGVGLGLWASQTKNIICCVFFSADRSGFSRSEGKTRKRQTRLEGKAKEKRKKDSDVIKDR